MKLCIIGKTTDQGRISIYGNNIVWKFVKVGLITLYFTYGNHDIYKNLQNKKLMTNKLTGI
jgi:hypothetical protein